MERGRVDEHIIDFNFDIATGNIRGTRLYFNMKHIFNTFPGIERICSLHLLIHDVIFYMAELALTPIDCVMLAMAYPPWANVLASLLPFGPKLTECAYRFGNRNQIQWFDSNLEFIQYPLRRWKGFFARTDVDFLSLQAPRHTTNFFDDSQFSQITQTHIKTSRDLRRLLIDNISVEMLPWLGGWCNPVSNAHNNILFMHDEVMQACERSDPAILAFILSHASSVTTLIIDPMDNGSTRMDILMQHLVTQGKWDHLLVASRAILDWRITNLATDSEKRAIYIALVSFNHDKTMEIAHLCGAFLTEGDASYFFWNLVSRNAVSNVRWMLTHKILAVGRAEIDQARIEGLRVHVEMDAFLRAYFL